MPKWHYLAACGAAILVSASPQAALAQASAAGPVEPETGVGEVVITAQRREQSLQRTPVAVTALTASSLAERQVSRVENLIAGVPSLTVQQVTASPTTLSINLRGASDQTGGLITSESPVAIYIDDVYQARLSTANFDLADISRIEVLRGPQGTLYGRNSMTGAIKFITRAPGSDWSFNAEGSVGSFDTWRAKANLAGPLGEHLGFTLSGLVGENGGWMYDTALGRKVGDRKERGVRGAIGLVDSGPLTAVVRANWTRSYGEGQYFVPVDPVTFAPLAGGFSNTRSPVPSNADMEQYGVSLHLGYKLGNVELRSVTAYQHLDDRWGIDFSGGLKLGTAPVVAGFFRQSDAHQKQTTQEFQLLSNALDGRLNLVGGLFYFRETADQLLNDTFGTGVFGAFPVVLLPTQIQTVSRSYAAYGQAEFKATDQLTLSAGLRYTDDKKTLDGLTQNGFGFPFAYAPTVNAKQSASVTTPKFTAQYQVTSDLMTYATVARGYRAGGFNGLTIANPAIFRSTYEPEYAWSYEGGVKAAAFERRLQINAAVYYQNLSDLQQSVTLADGSTLIQNAAKARLIGLEVEASAKPTPSIDLFANLTLTDDKYEKLAPNTAAFAAGAKRLPLISHTQAQFGGSWRLTPSVMRGGAVVFGADISYRSPRYSDATNNPAGLTRDITLVNASVTFKTAEDHWELQFAGRNVFDTKRYFSGLLFIPGLIAYRQPMEPAMWSATLRTRW